MVRKLGVSVPLVSRKLLLTFTALLACLITFGTFDAAASTTATPALSQSQQLAKALKACKKLPKNKQAACVKRARKRYGTPVAPPGPTVAWLTQQECVLVSCNTTGGYPQILNVTVITRGTPHLGTGLTVQAGGDGVPKTTWVYPLLFSYDFIDQQTPYTPYNVPPQPPVTETAHWRVKGTAQLDNVGQWVLRFTASSCVSTPDAGRCPSSVGGGA